jgi:hypothetical protein
LLDCVRELVTQEALPLRRLWVELAFTEDDVLPDRERLGTDAFG